MSTKQLVRVGFLSFFLFFVTFSTAHAVMFRMMDGPLLGKAASTPGSMAFKGKVLKVEQGSESVSVTFQIQDALKGKIKGGEVMTLQFPDMKFNNNLRLSMGIPPPQNIAVGAEGVWFTTKRALDGKTLLIAGEQGEYYLSKEGGKTTLYNSLGNANFFTDRQANNPLMQKVVQGMQERKSGTITYEDFKKLINE